MHFFKYLFEKKGDPFDLLSSFCWLSAKTSTVLDNFWDISRDWERLQSNNYAWEIEKM